MRILSTILPFVCATAQAQDINVSVKGEITNAEGKMVYLFYGDSNNPIVDSTLVENGKFSYNGSYDKPYTAAMLTVGTKQPTSSKELCQLHFDGVETVVNADGTDLSAATIQGGKTQQEQNEYNAQMKPVMDELMRLNREYGQADEQGRDSLNKLMEPYRKEYNDISDNFYKTHPDSYISPSILRIKMSAMKYKELQAAFDAFTPNVQKYGDGAGEIAKELEVLAKVRPGKAAPDFTATDINGKPFTLSDLKGKVVIIDFWASWCVPCRKSNPHMKELYNKYHERGLDFVYVGDDDSYPDKWRTAVEKDELVGEGFHHVLRGLVWDRSKGLAGMDRTNDINDKYAVHYLPTKYLIDRDGNIVCKIEEQEGATLDARLEELLK